MSPSPRASELRAWLESIDLGQYASSFLDHDIDLAVLPELTDADMRELDVSMGHRKRLLREIQLLATPTAGSSTEATALPQKMHATPVAERRRVTVVFADLVGSTDLSVRYDPEDLRQIILAYQTCCQQIVERWSGHILNYMGDGVVICFGYPIAHEDSPERAVRAALEIIDGVGRLRPISDLRLHTRVGIATGEVVIGDLEGDEAVAGETPNLAARLQGLAGRDRVVISTGTRRLIEGLFALESIGQHELKGFSEPQEVWQIKGDIKGASRFEARRQQRALPLIGRDDEMATLKERWQQAKAGQGQAVLISGEAGMGKSHLCDTLRQMISDEAHTRLRYFCAPYHQNSVLFPVISQLERSANIEKGDDDASKLAKLETRILSGKDDHAQTTALIAELLSIETDDRYPSLDMTSQRQRIATLDALLAEVAALAANNPVFIIFEDAHWSDPTTVEVFGRLMQEAIQSLPILLLVTYRPDLQSDWPANLWISEIKLDRVGVSDSHKIIAGIAEAEDIPEKLVADIVSKSDGVPLFVEELTRAVLDMKDERRGAGETEKHRAFAVPDTLHDSLMAKLDRLHVAKPIAQLGAVIGRRFTYGVLSAVAGLDEPALHQALDDLVKSDVVHRHGKAQSASYIFKHALIQEAAYSSLLHSRVRQLHGEIASVLEARFPDIAHAEPEVLAHHFMKGNMPDKAAIRLTEAGLQATSRGAQTEAINHFTAAIELLNELPETDEREQQEIKLRALLGSALIAVKGYAADDVKETFRLAHDLCIKQDDSVMLCPVMYGLWVVNLARSDRQATTEMADQMLERFGASNDPSQRIGAIFANGITAFYRGDLNSSFGWLDQVVDLYGPDQHDQLIQSYSDDLGLFALAQLEWLETLRGNVDAAKAHEREAIDLAEQLKDPMSMTRSLVFAMMHHRDLRDIDGTEQMANRALELAGEHVFPFWSALAQCGTGWAMANKGDHAAGIEAIEQGLSFFALIDQKLPLTYWNGYLIEALMQAGDTKRAATLVDATLELSNTNVDSFFGAALQRCKGILQLTDGNDPNAAERSFRDARALAFQQGAALLEHRSTVSLAKLLEELDRADEANALLLETRDRSPISTEAPDYSDAEALLARLG